MNAGSFKKILVLLICMTFAGQCHSRYGRGRRDAKPLDYHGDREHYRVRRNVGQAGTNLPKCLGLYNLPVHFHVIKASDGRYNVTADVLMKQLQVLNEAYNGTIFEFTLHGMNWIENDAWASDCGRYKDVFKQRHAADTMRVLNIYICPLMQMQIDPVYGDSVFPWEYPEGDKRHGVIIDTTTVPGGSDEYLNMGKNAVHETGFYFGLFPLDKDGCNANQPGDYVDDTPRQLQWFGCPDWVEDTCPDLPGNDLIDNFMGYADDACMKSFTPGQIERMNYMFRKYHPWLVKAKAMRPCNLQGIFRWSNGHIYMFAGDKYYRYDERIHNIDETYPKQMDEFWKGIPFDIDDVFMDKEERTYFIKDGLAYRFDRGTSRYPKAISTIWEGVPDTIRAGFQYSDGYLYLFDNKIYFKVNTTTESVVAGYPKLMSSKFKGVPEDVASALTWYNDDVYFFKNESYWVWSPNGEATKKKPISEWWRHRPALKKYAAFWHCNGLTYFFNGSSYWRFDDDKFQVDRGYPKKINSVWVGVPDNIDDAFTGKDGNVYFFKDDIYYTYNPDTGKTKGQGSFIQDDWPGVPNKIDGVFTYSNELTYFFKGDQYYRYNETSKHVDPGYPKKINSFWKGVPSDISSVMRWSNGMTYFFKGDKYYRFNDETTQVDPGYPLSIATWKGVLYQP